jgi:hypothetical protein
VQLSSPFAGCSLATWCHFRRVGHRAVNNQAAKRRLPSEVRSGNRPDAGIIKIRAATFGLTSALRPGPLPARLRLGASKPRILRPRQSRERADRESSARTHRRALRDREDDPGRELRNAAIDGVWRPMGRGGMWDERRQHADRRKPCLSNSLWSKDMPRRRSARSIPFAGCDTISRLLSKLRVQTRVCRRRLEQVATFCTASAA